MTVERCCTWFEAFIGGMSILVGVSLFLNFQSLIYLLLEFHGIRVPVAVGFLLSGAFAVICGFIGKPKWRILSTSSMFMLWVLYCWVSNSYSFQFPIGMLSLLVAPTLAWLTWRNVRGTNGARRS